jgi:adenylate cyclase
MIAHEVADAIPHEKKPVRRVCDGREPLRRRLDLPDDELDFEVLIELRERGGTDYIALPIDGVYAAAYMLTFVTDRPHGFDEPILKTNPMEPHRRDTWLKQSQKRWSVCSSISA